MSLVRASVRASALFFACLRASSEPSVDESSFHFRQLPTDDYLEDSDYLVGSPVISVQFYHWSHPKSLSLSATSYHNYNLSTIINERQFTVYEMIISKHYPFQKVSDQ